MAGSDGNSVSVEDVIGTSTVVTLNLWVALGMGGWCQHQGCSFSSPLLFAAGWSFTSRQECLFTLHRKQSRVGEGR